MTRGTGKLYVGTSGWVYSHWEGIFYPEDLPLRDKLKYFSQHFKTTEINYSFYHLPRPTTYQKWYSETPGDFIFAVKASRYITHIKRLKGVKRSWKIFIKNTLNLKEKLGPILFQFPPSFKATKETLKRLEKFLMILAEQPSCRGRTSINLRYAFEFRHKTWCEEKIYELFKEYNVAWVIADSPNYPYIETLRKFRSAYGSRARLYRGRLARGENRPKAEEITADFVYIRMHGSKILFSSKYTKKELSSLSQKIKKWLKDGIDVYVYFNNDAMAYAVENAKTLIKYL